MSKPPVTTQPKRLRLCWVPVAWTRLPVYVLPIPPDAEDLANGFDESSRKLVVYGKFSPTDREILLDSRIRTELEFRDTLIHETLHAIDDVCGLGLEHSAVATIAAALVQALPILPAELWEKYRALAAQFE